MCEYFLSSIEYNNLYEQAVDSSSLETKTAKVFLCEIFINISIRYTELKLK